MIVQDILDLARAEHLERDARWYRALKKRKPHFVSSQMYGRPWRWACLGRGVVARGATPRLAYERWCAVCEIRYLESLT